MVLVPSCPPNRLQAQPASNDIHTLKWDHFGPEMTKLLPESHGVFAAVQERAAELMRQSIEHIPLDECKQFSRHYRAILRAHAIANGVNNEEAKLLSSGELLWHMMEIFCLDQGPTSLPLSALIVEWYHWHFADPEWEKIAQLSEPSNDERYWESAYHLALQGRVHQCADLIARHPARIKHDVASKWIEDTMKLLETTPIRTGPSPSFAHHLSTWQSNAHVLLESLSQHTIRTRAASESIDEHIRDALATILKIVVGDFDTMANCAESWYELLVGYLVYCYPNVQYFDMKYRAAECLEKLGIGVDVLTDLDNTLLALLNHDIQGAVELAASVLPGEWLGAHLTDLLYHAGQFKPDSRERYILAFTQAIVTTDTSLWLVSVEYCKYCPVAGRDYASCILSHIYPSTTSDAELMVASCDIFTPPLTHVSLQICRQTAQVCQMSGNVSEAVKWFIRGGSSENVAGLADAMLNDAIEHGTHESLVTLADSLGGVVDGGRLAFIPTYRLFREAAKKKSSDASKHLMDLISSAPRRFIAAILIDALPVLESEDVIIPVDVTCALMEALESLAASHRAGEWLGGVTEDELSAVRLGMTRNLARGVCASGVGPDE